MKLLHKPPAQKYRQLLIVLIFVFFTSPFLKAKVGGIFSALMLLYTIILIIRSLKLPRIPFGRIVTFQ
ncbi:MAG: hypothetical protein QNJ46_32955 [Leptolyngbyaceae cyanobacterium MO_188.B28]|nr:hypothetical protein [Leptolyngbyaceae cyanobacterium MO_188.B28]